MATTLSRLSPELILIIASFLPDEDLVRFCRASKYHATLCKSLLEDRELLEFENQVGFNSSTEELEAEGFRLLTMDFLEKGGNPAGLPEFWLTVKKEASINRAIEERVLGPGLPA